jgi:hypothetical protein
MSEYMMIQQLIQSLGGANAIYVAGMFAALLWRRESVMNWGLFRASYLLFAASLLLPPIIQSVVMMTMASGGFRTGGMQGDANVLLSAISGGIGPGLFAGAVICGLGSMMPRRIFNMPPPASEPKPQHPLD